MSSKQCSVKYRPIKGFPGYRVGDDGSVWSKIIRKGLGWRYGFAILYGPWKKLKARPNPAGYLIVCLFPGAKWKTVHTIVLTTFHGPRPKGMQACHSPDHTKTNCKLSNLRWDTPASNYRDRDLHGRTCRGERHHDSQVTEAQVRKLRKCYRTETHNYFYVRHAARLGVSKCLVARIVLGKTWKHVIDHARESSR